MKSNKKTRLAVFLLLLSVAVFLVGAFWYFGGKSAAKNDVNTTGLPSWTADQLKEFDGSNPDKPIYVAVGGLVYDVTEGRKFYETGGSYHFLAGRDGTADLGPFAGAITNKYPVIAKLQRN